MGEVARKGRRRGQDSGIVDGHAVRALVELEELKLGRLKSGKEPVTVWRVIGEKEATSRFAAHAGSFTNFVGRDQEVALLTDRWHHRPVWLIVALVQWLHTALAWWAPSPVWFLVVFALVGVSLGAEAT